jgi:hypothetical protein
MRTRITLCALAALSIAGCQKAEEQSAEVAAAPAADAAAAPSAQTAARPERASPTLAIPQLAYVYKYALAAPPDGVRSLVARHERACWMAGPEVCQVTGSTIEEEGRDEVSATLTLRAQPQWLRMFRQGLEADTKAAGGRMVTTDTASDDLSRDLVDTEAALKAKTVLRDRLQETLRTRPGKAKDFFEMEQQLAGVQAEIDATRSGLADMRTRVAASELRIDYRSEGLLAPHGSLAPLGSAMDDVVGIFVGALAFLIRALALLTPVAGLGAFAWWLSRKLNPKKAARTPASPT